MFIAVAELLDGEHHAGQWRVEGGGDASGAAGKQEAGGIVRLPEAEPAPDHVHDAGADMHRRALAADRGASQQGQHGQSQLARRHPQRQVGCTEFVVRHFQCRDYLRDTAAARGPQAPIRKPGQGREDRRGKQQRPPGRNGIDPLEQGKGRIAGLGEQQGDQGDRDGATPQRRAAFPCLARQQRPQCGLGFFGRKHRLIVACMPGGVGAECSA